MRIYVLGLLLSFLGVGLWTGGVGVFFQINTFMNIDHADFDGTVYPYLHAIDWVNLDDGQRDLPYSQIPEDAKISPISYKPN